MKKNIVCKFSVSLCAAAIGASFLLVSPIKAQTNEAASNEAKQSLVQENTTQEESSDNQDVSSTSTQISDNAENAPAQDIKSDQTQTAKLPDGKLVAQKIKVNTQTKPQIQNTNTSKPDPKEMDRLGKKYFGLDKPDELSAEQLKEKGLDTDVYINDKDGRYSLPKGAKYRLIGKITFYGSKKALDSNEEMIPSPDYNNVLYSFSFTPHHHLDGSSYSQDEMFNIYDKIYNQKLNDPNYNNNPALKRELDLISYVKNELWIQPFVEGKTIYIDVGHKLTEEDLKRGYFESGIQGTFDTQWDQQSLQHVNINQVGSYNGTLGIVTFKNGTSTSFNVPIVVCDPEGKTLNLKVNDPAPDVLSSVTVDPLKNTQTGLKLVWENPNSVSNDMKAAGTYHENVLVTYPDGSKGKTAVVTIIVSADGDNHEVTPTPTPSNPTPTPQPSTPTQKPEVPDEPAKPDTTTTHVLSQKPSKPEKTSKATKNKKQTAKRRKVSTVGLPLNKYQHSTNTGRATAEPIKTSLVREKTRPSQKATLPQTGEKTNFFAMIGLALASIGSMMLGRKRKEN